MSLTEFEIIKQYFTRQPRYASVVESVGNDCATVSLEPNKQLTMSMDTLVAGRHFPFDATPEQIATRALCTSLSDLAAMGATPLWFTLGLTLPNADEDWLRSFSHGLFYVADQFNIDLIGGDTTQGPLTITVQVHGEVEMGQGLKRSAAAVGDAIFVTGTLGDGAAALDLLVNKSSQREYDNINHSVLKYLTDRFYCPMPQIEAGQLIAPFASSAIDISDGLLADASHIAESSNVQLAIDIDCLPIAPVLIQSPNLFSQECLSSWALSGGDDYQLLFTVGQEKLKELKRLIDENLVQACCIGQVVEGSGVSLFLDGVPYNTDSSANDYKGYQHFAS